MHQVLKYPSVPLSLVAGRKGYHWYVVMTVCIGAFMAALDASIINIALPTLQQQFHVSMNMVEWVSLVYLLTLASLIITFGRIADMFGRRWMYTGGFIIFLFGSLMCGVSDGYLALLFWRIVQAVGAAMLQANSVSIITAITPSYDRGKAIGIQASAQGIGLTLGPALGGFIMTNYGWRWLFLINVPIGLIGTLLAYLLLPKDSKRGKQRHFDYWGMLFLTPALIFLVYVLNTGQRNGWTSPIIILSLLTAVMGLAAFVREEKRTSQPLIDFALFSNRTFTLGNITGLLSYTVMYSVLLLSPYYIEKFLPLTTVESGLVLTAVPLGMTLLTPFSGALADRFGIRAPTIIGMGLAFIGCLVLALMGGSHLLLLMILGLFILGTGMGMFTPPNNSSVMGNAPAERLGVAGGMLNMARTFGMGFGVTLGGMLFQIFATLEGRNHPGGAERLAYHYSFFMIAVIAGIALFLSIFRNRKKPLYQDVFMGEGI